MSSTPLLSPRTDGRSVGRSVRAIGTLSWLRIAQSCGTCNGETAVDHGRPWSTAVSPLHVPQLCAIRSHDRVPIALTDRPTDRPSVLGDSSGVELILGLDMIMALRTIVDARVNCVEFGDTQVPFLA